jgi:hypothetical protein
MRFLTLLFFLLIASIVPFPLKYYRKDNLPTYKIEQLDNKKEENQEEEEEKRFLS